MFLHLTPEEATLRRLELAAGAIGRAVYTPLAELALEGWVTDEPVPFAERETGTGLCPLPSDTWGKLWDCAWFHATGLIPETAHGRRVVALIDLGGEACVMEGDEPVLGLTPAASGFDAGFGSAGKRIVLLQECAAGGEHIDLWLEAGCNDLFGDLPNGGRVVVASVAAEDVETLGLYYDFSLLLDLARSLPAGSARRTRITKGLIDSADKLKRFNAAEITTARNVLKPILEMTGGSPSLTISATGQAHLDLAWLWPIRETIRKGGRTFATALTLMDRYPEYVFGASQPQLYQWMKKRYPRLYSRVKQRICDGRWEPQGAMWVEADMNIPSGESLVRQILYGTRFYREEFGHEAKVAWLPDNFGFPASLPQILRKSGIDYFLTIKLSWNSTTVFPRHSFWWRGIDGSRILAHMPPEGTYNSAALPHSVAKIESSYLDKDVSTNAALLYGIGDGGGGPGVEHLERLARLRNLDGVAPVRQENSVSFFRRLEDEASEFRTWDGELYLERHQGTFTTQGRIKRNNRALETALRDAEMLSVMAAIQGHSYPKSQLDALWQETLLYQFHDILPGSSIARVYDEANARMEVILLEARAIVDSAAAAIAANKGVPGRIDTSADYVVFNTLPWNRSAWKEIDGGWRHLPDIPSMGYAVCTTSQEGPSLEALSATSGRLENERLVAMFNDAGILFSLIDKHSGRELIGHGGGNVLTVYHDEGHAWDFPPGYRNSWHQNVRLIQTTPLVEGPRAILRQRFTVGESIIDQDVSLTAGGRRLDFETRVAWHETHTMLRVAFDCAPRVRDVLAEIQFGAVRRPVHRNTAWDVARDEFCAHRWVDLSQRDFGVALLNDCKYGHSVRGSVVELNLLRSPTSPDPTADQGFHQFTYALYPHDGDYVTGEVPLEALDLNVPLIVTPSASMGELQPLSLFQTDGAGVLLDAVKQAEDSEDVVVRLYEWTGGNSSASIVCGVPLVGACETDLMENPIREVPVVDSAVQVTLRPFEVMTLKMKMA